MRTIGAVLTTVRVNSCSCCTSLSRRASSLLEARSLGEVAHDHGNLVARRSAPSAPRSRARRRRSRADTRWSGRPVTPAPRAPPGTARPRPRAARPCGRWRRSAARAAGRAPRDRPFTSRYVPSRATRKITSGIASSRARLRCSLRRRAWIPRSFSIASRAARQHLVEERALMEQRRVVDDRGRAGGPRTRSGSSRGPTRPEEAAPAVHRCRRSCRPRRARSGARASDRRARSGSRPGSHRASDRRAPPAAGGRPPGRAACAAGRRGRAAARCRRS